LAFTPDDRFLIGGSPDGTERVFEIATCKEIYSIARHEKTVAALAVSPNGRLVASAGSDLNTCLAFGAPQKIRFRDIVAGKEHAVLSGHHQNVSCLAFSPDGKQLVTGLQDATALVGGVPAAALDARFAVEAIPSGKIEAVWSDLGSAEAKRGQDAVLRLVRDPAQALDVAERQLHPVESPKAEEVLSLIEGLAEDDFKERELASEKLAAYGEVIAPQLSKAVADSTSLDVRSRCAELLQKIHSPVRTGTLLAEARAVQVLEWIGDARARTLLTKLAQGAKGAVLTKEAQVALARLPQ